MEKMVVTLWLDGLPHLLLVNQEEYLVEGSDGDGVGSTVTIYGAYIQKEVVVDHQVGTQIGIGNTHCRLCAQIDNLFWQRLVVQFIIYHIRSQSAHGFEMGLASGFGKGRHHQQKDYH